MSFGLSLIWPLMLMLIVPLVATCWVFRRGQHGIAQGLPGDWARVVGTDLHGYLARIAAVVASRQLWICAVLAAGLILALTRPGWERQTAPDYANLSGRIVILDATGDLSGQRILLDDLLSSAAHVPTALVAIAGEAYRIVPITTDGAQIQRYAKVLTPDVMPRPGRSLHLGLAESEAVLTQANIAVGQIVLLGSGPAPGGRFDLGPTGTQRVVVPLSPSPEWTAFADHYDAEIVDPDDLASLNQQLQDNLANHTQTRVPDARIDLGPYLICLIMVGWLLLFRRRGSV